MHKESHAILTYISYITLTKLDSTPSAFSQYLSQPVTDSVGNPVLVNTKTKDILVERRIMGAAGGVLPNPKYEDIKGGFAPDKWHLLPLDLMRLGAAEADGGIQDYDVDLLEAFGCSALGDTYDKLRQSDWDMSKTKFSGQTAGSHGVNPWDHTNWNNDIGELVYGVLGTIPFLNLFLDPVLATIGVKTPLSAFGNAGAGAPNVFESAMVVGSHFFTALLNVIGTQKTQESSREMRNRGIYLLGRLLHFVQDGQVPHHSNTILLSILDLGGDELKYEDEIRDILDKLYDMQSEDDLLDFIKAQFGKASGYGEYGIYAVRPFDFIRTTKVPPYKALRVDSKFINSGYQWHFPPSDRLLHVGWVDNSFHRGYRLLGIDGAIGVHQEDVYDLVLGFLVPVAGPLAPAVVWWVTKKKMEEADCDGWYLEYGDVSDYKNRISARSSYGWTVVGSPLLKGETKADIRFKFYGDGMIIKAIHDSGVKDLQIIGPSTITARFIIDKKSGKSIDLAMPCGFDLYRTKLDEWSVGGASYNMSRFLSVRTAVRLGCGLMSCMLGLLGCGARRGVGSIYGLPYYKGVFDFCSIKKKPKLYWGYPVELEPGTAYCGIKPLDGGAVDVGAVDRAGEPYYSVDRESSTITMRAEPNVGCASGVDDWLGQALIGTWFGAAFDTGSKSVVVPEGKRLYFFSFVRGEKGKKVLKEHAALIVRVCAWEGGGWIVIGRHGIVGMGEEMICLPMEMFHVSDGKYTLPAKLRLDVENVHSLISWDDYVSVGVEWKSPMLVVM